MGFLNTCAEQDLLFVVSRGVIGFGCFFLVLCGWRRDDDPDADPREQGYWDWRPDAGLVAGTCIVAVGLGGLVGSLFLRFPPNRATSISDAPRPRDRQRDRKRLVAGKNVSERVVLRRTRNKKKNKLIK